ncbi:MAG: TM2 domain-containing protein [Coriobacteriia bacterium]|nr:TM2 domain-containing protein [Coriobacteriia bacterium]
MSENEFPQSPQQAVPQQPVPGQPVPGQPYATPGAAPAPSAPVPPPTYQVPPQQQYAQPAQPVAKTRSAGIGSTKKEKWPAVLLACVLGALGLHKFYLGYKTEGIIMLAVSLGGSILTFGLAYVVMQVIGIIEGVRYLTLIEDEWEATYLRGYKGWL